MAIQDNNADNTAFTKTKVTGTVFVAPKGTELPKDAVSDLDTAFENVGYVGEDGITWTVDTDTQELKEMGGGTVRKEISSYAESAQFTLIEYKRLETNKLRYGADNVTEDKGTLAIKHMMPDTTPRVMVIDTVLTGGTPDRIVIPLASLGEIGDVTRSSGEALAHDVTFNFGISSELGGATSVEYIGTPKEE